MLLIIAVCGRRLPTHHHGVAVVWVVISLARCAGKAVAGHDIT